MGFSITREQIVVTLNRLVNWGDAEDANELLDILLVHYSLEQAYTWLFFHNRELGATPLFLLEVGQARAVFKEARRLVSEVATP